MFDGLAYPIMGAFLAIVGGGFFNGVARLTSAIIAIYSAALFAAAFYRPLTDAVADVVVMNRRTGELVFFLLLFAVFAGVFTTIISRWLGDLRLPRRIAILDNLGGAALGVVISELAAPSAALVLAPWFPSGLPSIVDAVESIIAGHQSPVGSRRASGTATR